MLAISHKLPRKIPILLLSLWMFTACKTDLEIQTNCDQGACDDLNTFNFTENSLITRSESAEISWSQVNVARGYDIVVSDDPLCQKISVAYREIQATSMILTNLPEGNFYLCTYALISNGKFATQWSQQPKCCGSGTGLGVERASPSSKHETPSIPDLIDVRRSGRIGGMRTRAHGLPTRLPTKLANENILDTFELRLLHLKQEFRPDRNELLLAHCLLPEMY